MPPGELRALLWSDVDLDLSRVTVSPREYRGRLDSPKNAKAKEERHEHAGDCGAGRMVHARGR
jgi:hypothetical protein